MSHDIRETARRALEKLKPPAKGKAPDYPAPSTPKYSPEVARAMLPHVEAAIRELSK